MNTFNNVCEITHVENADCCLPCVCSWRNRKHRQMMTMTTILIMMSIYYGDYDYGRNNHTGIKPIQTDDNFIVEMCQSDNNLQRNRIETKRSVL